MARRSSTAPSSSTPPAHAPHATPTTHTPERAPSPSPSLSALDSPLHLLPLPVELAVCEQNPAFAALLTRLTTHHISGAGLTRAKHEDLEEARKALARRKQGYLQHDALLRELRGLLCERRTEHVGGDEAAYATTTYGAMERALAAASAAQHLRMDVTGAAGGETHVLGLSPADLARPAEAELRALHATIIPELEVSLRQRCEQLLRFYNPSLCSGSDAMIHAKALQLSAMLAADRAARDSLHVRRRALSARLLQLHSLHSSALLASLDLLETLIGDLKLRAQPAADDAAVRALQATAQAARDKLWVLIWQVMVQMYAPEHVAALAHVRAQLDREVESQAAMQRRVKESLQLYRSVGLGLDELVEEFVQLAEMIKKMRWALETLR